VPLIRRNMASTSNDMADVLENLHRARSTLTAA
jgi:hypothetical protein